MEMNELISRRSLAVTLWRREVPYFDRDQAVSVVDACEEEGSAILGIEGFQIDGESIVPRMDWIADFSPYSREMEYREFVAISAKYARVFLELPNSENVLFEFCI